METRACLPLSDALEPPVRDQVALVNEKLSTCSVSGRPEFRPHCPETISVFCLR